MEDKYVKCEEGESQYDNIDVNSNNIVTAKYIHAILNEDNGNSYIEALPLPRDEREIILAYNKSLASFQYDKVKKMTRLEKLLQIGTLRNLRFPLPFHKDLEFNMYNALITSYRARKQQNSSSRKIEYTAYNYSHDTTNILTGDSSCSTNAGFSLIGYSGCGKSSAINILVSHYPQVIMHMDEDEKSYYPQIVYLVVNCISNSNFSALYQGIGDAIDKAFGNPIPVYSKEIEKIRGLGNKAEKIKEYVEKFAIGIIIFDEIQLIDFEHTKENTFDSLLTLANRTKVAIAVVGTEDARDKMFHELRTARRIGTMINGNIYCNNRIFFGFLVKILFSYQWFDCAISPDNEIIDTLYDVTKGIVDQLIGVYSCMNYDYIEKKNKPIINKEYILNIANKYYPGIQSVLANIESYNSEQKINEIRQNVELRLEELIDNAKQEEEAQRLININSDTQKTVIYLKNIIATITALFSEYDDAQIEDAYEKIMKKKSSVGKSEKEIARLVINSLQKVQTKRKLTNQTVLPDMKHMQDFLGI